MSSCGAAGTVHYRLLPSWDWPRAEEYVNGAQRYMLASSHLLSCYNLASTGILTRSYAGNAWSWLIYQAPRLFWYVRKRTPAAKS